MPTRRLHPFPTRGLTVPTSAEVPLVRQTPLILLVQDDRALRLQYAERLRAGGFDVAEAENGLQALEMVTVLGPDVIVADLDIPSIDGLEFCRRLRSEPRRTDSALVALAARSTPGAAAGRADGEAMDARLLKPCPPERLLAEIRYLVDVVVERRDHAARARTGRDASTTMVDADALERMRAEFDELPSLRLTVDQAQRLFHLGADETGPLLQALVADGFLRIEPNGRYERAAPATGALPRRRMVKADVDATRRPAPGRRRSDGSRS
jgi:CheY-like chemotaxis protein